MLVNAMVLISRRCTVSCHSLLFFFSFPAHLAPSLFGFFVFFFFFDVHRPFYLNYSFLSSKQKKKVSSMCFLLLLFFVFKADEAVGFSGRQCLLKRSFFFPRWPHTEAAQSCQFSLLAVSKGDQKPRACARCIAFRELGVHVLVSFAHLFFSSPSSFPLPPPPPPRNQIYPSIDNNLQRTI